MEKEIVIRGIKILDIVYLTVIYFLIGAIVSVKVNKYEGKFNPEDYKDKKLKLFIEILIHLSFVGIFVYITRNLIELLPFPFEGVYGYDHNKIKELSGGFILTFTYFLFQKNLQKKIVYFFTNGNGN